MTVLAILYVDEIGKLRKVFLLVFVAKAQYQLAWRQSILSHWPRRYEIWAYPKISLPNLTSHSIFECIE